jgi:hypothetical protein
LSGLGAGSPTGRSFAEIGLLKVVPEWKGIDRFVLAKDKHCYESLRDAPVKGLQSLDDKKANGRDHENRSMVVTINLKSQKMVVTKLFN